MAPCLRACERSLHIRLHEAAVADDISARDRSEAAFHPPSPFRERLAKHKGKIYAAGAGPYVASWLQAAVQTLIRPRPFYPRKLTFGLLRPLFDPLLPLHPHVRTLLAMPQEVRV